MTLPYIVYVYFLYGLAFFAMGVIVALEGGRASDDRLRHALRPLAAFGVVHGTHEWVEMFTILRLLPGYANTQSFWAGLQLAILAFSFLSLSAFGASLLAPTPQSRRLSLLVPLVQVAVWGIGLLIMRPLLVSQNDLWDAAQAWTRYVLAIPASVLAAVGLIAQQRVFRRAGMVSFSRDSLWAAVAFLWYGLVGQLFAPVSLLPLSSVINEPLFFRTFGFPVQLLRAVAAVAASIFIIRFLRAFEVENQRRITELQSARVAEAERREGLRGELLGQVVAAQEAERQRIARELHDATGQSLTALGLGLRGVATALGGERRNGGEACPLTPAGPAVSPVTLQQLRQMENLAANSLDELRRLIADLRPSHLDDLGLPATLRWYGKEVAQRSGLDVQVEIAGEQCVLSPSMRIALFRIAQEALNNTVKHACATSARVRLAFGADEMRLDVEDNGRGFELARQTGLVQQPEGTVGARTAWGLLGMRERAELLGGVFQVESHPGQGTRVSVTIPWQRDSQS
jgi:signal transduction histidine kinase